MGVRDDLIRRSGLRGRKPEAKARRSSVHHSSAERPEFCQCASESRTTESCQSSSRPTICLQDFVEIRQGITTGDDVRDLHGASGSSGWCGGLDPFQSTGDGAAAGGREQFLFWEDGEGARRPSSARARLVRHRKGARAAGAIRRSGFADIAIVAALYRGHKYSTAELCVMPKIS